MFRSIAAGILLLTLGFADAASAQDYPSRSLKFVVPFAAGSATDALARIQDAQKRVPPPDDQTATAQFEIGDSRSPQEIAAVLRRNGIEPVWKDWDAALMER